MTDRAGPTNPAMAVEHPPAFLFDAGGRRALQFNILALQSRLDLNAPDRLDLEYTRLMMAFLLVQPQPARIGMIGLGGGSLVRFCRRHVPHAALVVAECNPHVLALRDACLVPSDDERLCVLQQDGAAWLQTADLALDVLLVDGYDAEGLPQSLSTQRFFDDCAQALNPDGVVVMNLYTPPEQEAQILERMRRSLGGALLTVSDSDRSNRVVMGCRGDGLQHLRPGPPSRPRGLDAEAWSQLKLAFARVNSAWQAERA